MGGTRTRRPRPDCRFWRPDNTSGEGAEMNVASEYLQLSRESADELVRRHAPLVRRIAYHLMGRLPASVDVGDLIQAGMIGLLEAARHFAHDRGASFETRSEEHTSDIQSLMRITYAVF